MRLRLTRMLRHSGLEKQWEGLVAHDASHQAFFVVAGTFAGMCTAD